MEQAAGSGKPTSQAPVRGTQSFVGVMAQVWKRPSLTAIEVAWRWSASLVVLVLLAGMVVPWKELKQAWAAGQGSIAGGYPADIKVNFSFTNSYSHLAVILLAVLIWSAGSAWGRGVELRRLQPALTGKFSSLFVLNLLRAVCLLGVLSVWSVASFVLAEHWDIGFTAPWVQPGFLPFAAAEIVGTLTLFVLWMLASSVFYLAPVFAMSQNLGPWRSLREALRRGPLRSKLIEINLVMGIVKIALLVLAMVFSACPLPFSNVETQAFLNWWWAGVCVWYLLASDFFHVVRIAAALALWKVYANPSVNLLTPEP